MQRDGAEPPRSAAPHAPPRAPPIGLTLHHELHLPDAGPAEARRFLLALHHHAQTLGFESVSPLYEIDPPGGRFADGVDAVTEAEGIATFRLLAGHHQPLVPAAAEFNEEAVVEVHLDDWVDVPSVGHLLHFVTRDPGAEVAGFGLTRHPATVDAERGGVARQHATGLGDGYHGHFFCKTQYAGLPEHGGPANFIAAHTRLVHLLDHARDLGADVRIEDETGYATHRDQARLLATLGEHMRLIAAVTGALTDHFTEQGIPREKIHAPIHRHPAFEHLEAEGVRDLERREPPAEA